MKKVFGLFITLSLLFSCQSLQNIGSKKAAHMVSYKAADTIHVFLKNDIQVASNTNKKTKGEQLLSTEFKKSLSERLIQSLEKRNIRLINTMDRNPIVFERIVIKIDDYLSSSDVENFKAVSTEFGIIDDFEFQITIDYISPKNKKKKRFKRTFTHKTNLRKDLLTGIFIVEENKVASLENMIAGHIDFYSYKLLKKLLREN